MEFFAIEPLSVMVSSRCRDKALFQGALQELSAVRRAIKAELEAIRIGGKQVLRVWIHEDEAILAGDQHSWDRCMANARRSDLFLVLYNGNAGWPGINKKTGSRVGICHAEFQEAFDRCPSKVRSIQFPEIAATKGSPDARFQEYFQTQGVFGAQVTTGEDAIKSAVQAATAAILDLARAGVGVNSQGRYFAGAALDWTRKDYHDRRQIMSDTVIEYLSQNTASTTLNLPQNIVAFKLGGKKIALCCDSIPASMSTAAARELVGQPFLRDYQIAAKLPKGIDGPVHVIACQKTVTESQALKQLGFPDAIVVSAPFGVYVADDVQKIQMAFIANCRDETTTRHRIQRFLSWLNEQGEDRLLAARAASRRKIANQIAAEQEADAL